MVQKTISKKGSYFPSNVFAVFIVITLLICSISFASAITGSIGNARMILRASQGDIIDKTVLVKNVNDVSVNIEIFASGDLEKYIDVKDKKFTLAAGEEKNAAFTIKVPKNGTTESSINVKFSPLDGGNGVGLSSTVIIMANESDDVGLFDWLTGDDTDNTDNSDNGSDNSSVSVGKTNTVTGNVAGSSWNFKMNWTIVVFVLVGLFLVLIIVLLAVMLRNKKRRLMHRQMAREKMLSDEKEMMHQPTKFKRALKKK